MKEVPSESKVFEFSVLTGLRIDCLLVLYMMHHDEHEQIISTEQAMVIELDC